MKKNINILFVLFLTLTITLVSCTDENKFTNPVTFGLENGAFAAFETATPAAAYPDPQQITFSDVITDPNGTMANYNVKLIATLSGNVYVKEDFFNATSFPAEMSFNTQSLATALGLQTSDINFGDTFNFIATVTSKDGNEFVGIAPAFNSTTLEVSGGNTEPQLQTAGYKSAMQFNFIVACPFDQAAMVGTWTVADANGFHVSGGGSNGTGQTFEVVAGANADEIVLKNPFGSANNTDITVKASPFGIATFDWQFAFGTDEICCAGYTLTQIRSNAGATSLTLSCIGYIELKFNTRLGLAGGSPSGFSFGDGFFKANKN
ncbi:hypothetical protein [Polaribacter aquimarinus]|uniref:Uncharacterized protein n=1 Tax=Polaribacter aquimarinus TaxID=2100726 RepID=A0A2U2JDZ2_9FLAO|nr:hypothetical protein [Polaribacter aquimarinus]PWG06532.1 hypothetical protein DIS07_01480 [Polaribacter aquimarinus]